MDRGVFCVVCGLSTSIRCRSVVMEPLLACKIEGSLDTGAPSDQSPCGLALQRSSNSNDSSPAYFNFISIHGVRMVPILITNGKRSVADDKDPSDALK